MDQRRIVGAVLLLASLQAGAQALFVGTWRPDPQRPDPSEPPDVIELTQQLYTCHSCKPPYSVKADGHDQPVQNNPRFDTVSISVADAHTVLKTAKKGARVVAQSKTIVAEDGKSKTEVQTITGMAPHSIDMAITSERLAAGPAGSHAISGSWRILQADLVHHDEDTTYQLDGDTLSMSDGLGRSFKAKLDGTASMYRGDPRFTTVSLKLIDSRTIEETDKNGADTVLVTRWSIESDGKTMHAIFDDTRGGVQQQSAHKLP